MVRLELVNMHTDLHGDMIMSEDHSTSYRDENGRLMYVPGSQVNSDHGRPAVWALQHIEIKRN